VHAVLVARSEAPLQALALEITGRWGVKATVLAADLSLPGCGASLQRRAAAQGLVIDILINNAGFGTYGPFESLDVATEQTEIAVNVAAVVDLSHAFLPGMVTRRSGAIVNVASTAAFQPAPYMAVYAASKAFVLSFSEALWAECRGKGVRVAALCPGAVDTPFIKHLGDESLRKTPVFEVLLRPEQVSEAALKVLRGSSPSRIVGLKNWWLAQSVRFAPRATVARMGEKMLRLPT
jgi:short-subunit dehydrogenase